MRNQQAKLGSLIALVMLLCLAGCTRTLPVLGPEEQLLRTELYFGLSMPDGKTVSEAEWKDFLDQRITPRFRDGLTVLDASGQFLNKAGEVVCEKTKLVILIHPDKPEKLLAIRYVIYEYKQRFKQESVLRVTARAGVSF